MNQLKNFLKLCYKIIYNFTNTSPILKSSRILRFKTPNFSLDIKQSRLCFKPISDYFRCCLKVSIHGANIIDHDVAIALVIKRTAGKINGVSKSIASYSQVYLRQLLFFWPICFHFKQINLRQCRKNVHSSCANVGSTAFCLKQCRRYEGRGGLAPISVYSKFGTSHNDKTKDNDAKTNHNVQILFSFDVFL